jgi:predicted ATPase
VLPSTELFGRDDDVAAVVDLVRSGARLVTLTGPGGVGKTRLAAAVADALAADHPDGTVHVPLAALTDAARVLPAVGRAAGAPGSDGPDVLDVVADHLAERAVLVVLDNAEHLLSAGPDVAALVALCPHLTVLVSSRSPLRVRGEQEYGVAPLRLPSLDATTPDELAAAPAGALVLARARAVAPRLALRDRDVAALARLCVQLAGLPLAIELATARLRFLDPEDLLERLDDAASALAARDLPERQRTMRATLDWSYALLTPEQQTLFRALAVCRAGATLTTLEQVVARSEVLAASSVAGLLEGLVEQSLVMVRAGADGRLRYDMLEPVAQYARSLLVDPEARALVRAHTATFLELAEQASAGYERAEQVQWLARTEAEEANLLVAIDRSLDLGDSDSAGRITWSMWLYWWVRGQYTVGRRRAEPCLACDLSPAVRGRVHLAAATMSYAAGDVAAGARHWAEAARLGRAECDPALERTGCAGMGLVGLTAGDLGPAEVEFRRALELGGELGGDGVWLTSLVHVWLGTLLLLRGDQAGAIAEMSAGLELARGRGDLLTAYIALFNLAQARASCGDLDRARRHLEEGIELAWRTHDVAALAYLLDGLAAVEPADVAPERVGVLLGAAEALRETVGTGAYAYLKPDGDRRERARGAARAAAGGDTFDDAVDAGRALTARDAVRYALQGDPLPA